MLSSKIATEQRVKAQRVLDRAVFGTLGLLLTTFEDPVGLDRPLWRDYSYWQLVVDMQVAKANGVLGMFSRAGIGNTYLDPYFAPNWANAGLLGLYRSSYHVINSLQSVVSQADQVWYTAHAEREVIPRAIDLQKSYGAPPSQVADRTWEMSELVKARDGVRPIIYSRYSLINSWLVPYWTASMLNEHFYWLAQYLIDRTREHAGPPTLPTNVLREQVIMHQTADKKAGFPGECSGSATADYDRWEIGNEAEMHTWIATTWGGAPPEPPPGDLPMPIGYARVVAQALNLRAGPGTGFSDLGDLTKGMELPFFQEYKNASNDVWLRLSYSTVAALWFCEKLGNGTVFCERMAF